MTVYDSLTLDKVNVALTVGATSQVSISSQSQGTVVWTSSDEAIATVQNGLITAIAEGTATITATLGEATQAVNVTVSAAPVQTDDVTLTLDATELTLKVSGHSTITATISDGSALTWSSSDEAIALVDEGYIAGVAVGTATITVTNGTLSATCTVTVEAADSETKTPETDVEEESDMFTSRDYKTTYTADATITLSDSGSTTTATSGVTIDGSTITITAKGIYLIQGTLTDGQIVINVTKDDKVQLVLDNVDLTKVGDAAIEVLQADKVFVTTTNTSNKVTSTGTYTVDKINLTIYSKDDITFNGLGTLTITSETGHGVEAKDDLKITSGSYTIKAAKKGLDANDSIRIADGTFVISSGTDGIHAENEDDTSLGYIYIVKGTFSITAGTDAISSSSTLKILGGDFTLVTLSGANTSSSKILSTESYKGIKASASLTITGGTFNINTADDAIHTNGDCVIDGGTFTIASADDGIHADSTLAINDGNITITKSYEGLESYSIVINGGYITLTASDDGLNAAGGTDSSSGFNPMGGGSGSGATITIKGGELHVNASGDGIDSNGSIYMSGGLVYVNGPTSNGDAPFDYDGSAYITGGTIIALGSSGMAQNFGTSSTQGAILVKLSSSCSMNTVVTLKDSSGNVLFTYTATKIFQSVLISTPDIKKGSSYTLTVGSQSYSITMSSYIYTNGSSSQGGGQPGGNRPGGRWF